VNRGPLFALHEHANDTHARPIDCNTNERDALGVRLAIAVLAGEVFKVGNFAPRTMRPCAGMFALVLFGDRQDKRFTYPVRSAAARTDELWRHRVR
jgi:hypothetical protein